MRLLLTILTGILCTASAFAQPYIGWVQRFNGLGDGNDVPTAIAVDTGGNICVTGASYGGTQTSNDFATIKYDSLGNVLWIARYNGPADSNDTATDLAIDAFGNIYVTGNSVGAGTGGDFVTIKYFPTGDTAWVRRYNGPDSKDDKPVAITLDEHRNVYVTGSSFGNLTRNDFTTIKYDAGGNQLWVARYNGPGNHTDEPSALALDTSGNIYVTGLRFSSQTNPDLTTIKYDSNGGQLWVAFYDGPENFVDVATDIVVDKAGNAYVAGYSWGGTLEWDYVTIGYNPAGEQLWVARYNGTANTTDRATAIVLDTVGNLYVTGVSNRMEGFEAHNGDYATIKYDSLGNRLWVSPYNGPKNDDDVASAIALDATGNVYVTGLADGYSTDTQGEVDYDYTTIQYDANGNQLWAARYNGPTSYVDVATSLAVDANANVYVTGYSYGIHRGFYDYDVDFATIKYSATPLLKGDLDGNGALNLADIAFLLNCVFFGSGDCPPAFADVNCDGVLTPIDVVILLNVFFQLAAPPCASENGIAIGMLV